MIQMGVGHEEGLSPHERPWTGAQFKAQFEFRDSPVTLDCCPRIAFDGQRFVRQRGEWEIVQHCKMAKEGMSTGTRRMLLASEDPVLCLLVQLMRAGKNAGGESRRLKTARSGRHHYDSMSESGFSQTGKSESLM
jgi:hypothetical protein